MPGSISEKRAAKRERRKPKEEAKMAGLFDRFQGGGGDRVSVHNFQAVLILRAEGIINDTQAKTLINEKLVTPLEGSELTDANAILTVLEGKVDVAAKVRYALKVDAVNMLAETRASLSSDANWRDALEI